MRALPLLLLSTSSLAAVSSHQFDRIKMLGELNAVALQCGYMDQTRRIKAALVSGLPKRRELGFAFDQQTHESFLTFIEKDADCPEIDPFAEDVGRAIDEMERAFKAGVAE